MIENNKTELVEEEQESENVEADNRKFLRTGTIIIGSILFLMIVCIVAIFILESK